MKRLAFIFLIILSKNMVFGQSLRKIVKDLDGDLVKDTVYIDSDLDKIFCALSTNKFKKIGSRKIEILNFGNTLVRTKNGFEFWNDYGSSGFINEFRYNPRTKKIQLIKITRTAYDFSYTEYGDKVRDGSGKSSINLVTNKYTGNFYDLFNGKLVKLPPIYAEMIIPQTNLETFSDAVYFDYEKRCRALYEKNKKSKTR